MVAAKFKCQVLFQGISDATSMVIYHAVTIEKSEENKFLNSVFTFSLVIRIVLGLLKCLKETCFYERKKVSIIKTWTLHERKVHIKKKGRAYKF